jgi:hypothetical protein
MQAEDLIFYFCGNGQTLEEFSEQFPNEIGAVLPETFVIESVEFVDLPVFVVASEYGDSAFVFDFE